MAWAEDTRRVIVLPIGDVELELLRWLSQELGGRLGVAVQVGRPFPPRPRLPEPTDGARESDDLLDSLAEWFLSQHESDSPPILLGVTQLPLNAPGRPVLYGQATIGGCCAIITLHPLGPPEDNRRQERILKESVHELAHVSGLGHCTDPSCVMYPSTDISDTDRKSADFCARCAAEGVYSFPALGSP